MLIVPCFVKQNNNKEKGNNIFRNHRSYSFFPVNVIEGKCLVSCRPDHTETCTCDTRVSSRLFGGTRRRVSVSIPRARFALFDWPNLLFRSNEQRCDWLACDCVTPLKQVFYLRFLPDSDTCRITKQRGPRSAADDRHFQPLHQRPLSSFSHFVQIFFPKRKLRYA